MTINFTKLSPGGNDTIIVQSPVPRAKRADVARALMLNSSIGGEHVGFLTLVPAAGIDARVDMMGGELCVNALRSAAAMLSSQTAQGNLRISSSGTDEVYALISRPSSKGYYTSIALMMNPRIQVISKRTCIVYLEGIAFLLREFPPQATIDSLGVFTKLRQQYASEFAAYPAFGIMPFQRREESFEIFPVVYVRGTETVVPETGCGSGSIALALSAIAGSGQCNVIQPSGCTYTIDVERGDKGARDMLRGDVRILMRGSYELDSVGWARA